MNLNRHRNSSWYLQDLKATRGQGQASGPSYNLHIVSSRLQIWSPFHFKYAFRGLLDVLLTEFSASVQVYFSWGEGVINNPGQTSHAQYKALQPKPSFISTALSLKWLQHLPAGIWYFWCWDIQQTHSLCFLEKYNCTVPELQRCRAFGIKSKSFKQPT